MKFRKYQTSSFFIILLASTQGYGLNICDKIEDPELESFCQRATKTNSYIPEKLFFKNGCEDTRTREETEIVTERVESTSRWSKSHKNIRSTGPGCKRLVDRKDELRRPEPVIVERGEITETKKLTSYKLVGIRNISRTEEKESSLFPRKRYKWVDSCQIENTYKVVITGWSKSFYDAECRAADKVKLKDQSTSLEDTIITLSIAVSFGKKYISQLNDTKDFLFQVLTDEDLELNFRIQRDNISNLIEEAEANTYTSHMRRSLEELDEFFTNHILPIIELKAELDEDAIFARYDEIDEMIEKIKIYEKILDELEDRKKELDNYKKYFYANAKVRKQEDGKIILVP